MTHAIHRDRLSPDTVLFEAGRIVRVTPSPTDDDPLHCDIVAGVQHDLTLGDLEEVKRDLAMGDATHTVAFVVTGTDDDDVTRLTVGRLVYEGWLLVAMDGNWVLSPRLHRCSWTPAQLPGGAQFLNRGRCGVLVTQRGLASFRGAKIIPGV